MPNEPMPNESLSAEQETYVEEGKIWNSETPSSVDSNASKIDEFEDPCKEICQKH
jgi:hypothetical protein